MEPKLTPTSLGKLDFLGEELQVNACDRLIDLPKKKASEYLYLEAFKLTNGADYRNRTDDLPLTRRLLYQLS